MGARMSVEISYGEETYRFEKYPTAGTVNIYNDNGHEIDMFTNYEIGSDFHAFEIACQEHVDEWSELD
jgi:hypothetical protein